MCAQFYKHLIMVFTRVPGFVGKLFAPRVYPENISLNTHDKCLKLYWSQFSQTFSFQHLTETLTSGKRIGKFIELPLFFIITMHVFI